MIRGQDHDLRRYLTVANTLPVADGIASKSALSFGISSMMLLENTLLLAFVSLVAASPTPEILEKRAINCLAIGASATARWTNSAGQTCTYTGIVGSNYGANPSGSGE